MHKNNFNRGNHLIFLNSVLFFILISLLGYAQSENSLKISREIEESFHSEFLEKWYPLSIDKKKGGYFSLLTYQWKKGKTQNKMLVTQSRHVWTTSKVALMYPEKKDLYSSYAAHGVKFLKEKMWDEEFGGFYMMVDRKGEPLSSNYKDEKRAYGNSFAIYGLSAYYELTKDESALELAKRTFLWMDKNCHDGKYGGYFEQLHRDGSPIKAGGSELFDKIGYGKKDYNSSIHILEAFTNLYKIWPDAHLKLRLTEMLEIVRDRIITDQGYMLMLFHPDWTYIPFTEYQVPEERKYVFDHVTAGHDVETAFLLLEASHALDLKHDKKTMKKAKLM
ncbi:MAG: AGE family epimerase/isomerase, partial [Flammeovirgaceae bacterium]|nr:AGE family epimerase/isomerase [Flammeovirgaceae bacterium]